MGRKRLSTRLLVYMNTNRVGTLERAATGAISFQYDSSWLDNDKSMDISRSLPLRESPYSGPEVYAFFENLLPDGAPLRRRIAERVGAQSSEPFDLLGVIGRDCVGALQFLHENAPPPDTSMKIKGEPLSDPQIEQLLANLATTPLGMDRSTDFRISVAGAQDKTALLYHEEKWLQPLGTTPTSHIFKSPMGILSNGIDMRESVENEWLCLKICERFGLTVAKAEMAHFGRQRCLIVERFDRQWSSNGTILYRLPIEDMCQALGVSSTQKYESDGGPGIKQIMALLNTSNQRVRDRTAFFTSQIVFQLLGATDGHGKNFSIFLGNQGIEMTPIYDVLTVYPALSRKQIPRNQVKLAMAAGDSRKYGIFTIMRRHWYETAKAVAIPAEECDEIFDRIAKGMESVRSIGDIVPKGFSDRVLNQTLEGIEKMWRQLEAG